MASLQHDSIWVVGGVIGKGTGHQIENRPRESPWQTSAREMTKEQVQVQFSGERAGQHQHRRGQPCSLCPNTWPITRSEDQESKVKGSLSVSWERSQGHMQRAGQDSESLELETRVNARHSGWVSSRPASWHLQSETQGNVSSVTLDPLPPGQLNQFESELW